MLKAKRDQDAPDLPVRLDGLTDEPPPPNYARLLTWAGVALLAVSAALLAARTDAGIERFARLGGPAPFVQQARTEPPRPAASDPLLVYETRRLADQIRVLAAERETLMDRLASVERTVGDVTASIPRDVTASIPRVEATGAPRPGVRVIAPAAPTVLPATGPVSSASVSAGTAASGSLSSPPVTVSAALSSAPVPVPSPLAPATPPAPPIAAAPAVTMPPEAQDSTAIRTEFGVDLAGDPSIDGLRSRWQQLRAQHGPVLEGLRPVVSIQEGGGTGGLELRLVAGPLSNANAAARLCATLSLAGVNCKPTVFDGQRLALR
ncbi:MAG: hypothetical protein Q8O26_18725 [Phreatobacter sp.]|uniref:hypothetical protein n=1 Tax=Phreatobacter sp. TaxID=1966341 RepID=UPI00273289DE|nr:hypothetical protein [Phreatobacter sp.]MDP2803912.1 hypothetical protein [Phreatobacter sp.]